MSQRRYGAASSARDSNPTTSRPGPGKPSIGKLAIIGSALGVLIAVVATLLDKEKDVVSTERHAATATDHPISSSGPPPAAEEPAGEPRNAPPQIEAQQPPAVQNDSRQPDYDAVALYEMDDLPMRDIFGAEDRDPTWAPPMEERLTEIAASDVGMLGDGVRVKRIECRKQTCNIVLDADSQELLDNGIMMLNYTPLGNLQSAERALGDPKSKFSTGYVVAWEKDQKNPAFQSENYPEIRAARLEELRGMALPPEYPPLPEE